MNTGKQYKTEEEIGELSTSNSKPSEGTSLADRLIRGQDEVAPSIRTELHLNDDMTEKTIFGGLLSIGVKLLIAYIALKNLILMLDKRDPYVFSQIRTLEANNTILMEERTAD